MISIAAALQNGIPASELHRMVDLAADSIASLPRLRSPTSHPDWHSQGATPVLPNPLLQPSQPLASNPLQGLVNAANSLGMASSMPDSQNPQQQSLPLPMGQPHMYPAASGTYDSSTPGLLPETPLLAPALIGAADPAGPGTSSQNPPLLSAAAVGVRVQSESSADQHDGDLLAVRISPSAAARMGDTRSEAPGRASVALRTSQEAADMLPDGLDAGQGQHAPGHPKGYLIDQRPAAAATQDGAGTLLDAQPLRRKRSKRIKVEVPRESIGDDGDVSLGGTPKVRTENGHSYRNGSLKVKHTGIAWKASFTTAMPAASEITMLLFTIGHLPTEYPCK